MPMVPAPAAGVRSSSMDRRAAWALVLVVLVVVATVATRSAWPALLLLWAPLVAIALLTVGVWVARKLRI